MKIPKIRLSRDYVVFASVIFTTLLVFSFLTIYAEFRGNKKLMQNNLSMSRNLANNLLDEYFIRAEHKLHVIKQKIANSNAELLFQQL